MTVFLFLLGACAGFSLTVVRAIEKHASKYDLGYTVRVDPLVEIEPTRVNPPEVSAS